MKRVLVTAVLVAFAQEARADKSPWLDEAPAVQRSTEEPNSDEELSTGRRALAVGASIVPGVVIHGSGSWVAHEKGAAKKLLVAQLIGGAMMGISGAFVGGTRGSEYTIWPGVPVLIAGAGLVMQ
jgi:hypothetical protein